jgi:hypothetical protein
MPDEPASVDFLYVETDIPAGMTIAEWRAQRAQAARRRTPASRTLAALVQALIRRLGGACRAPALAHLAAAVCRRRASGWRTRGRADQPAPGAPLAASARRPGRREAAA